MRIAVSREEIAQPARELVYETSYSPWANFWSAPPLFLEDENIFQKSARVVVILLQFHLQPREPIFELLL
jgi:hypothetical protein